jgi:hypothetical protein
MEEASISSPPEFVSNPVFSKIGVIDRIAELAFIRFGCLYSLEYVLWAMIEFLELKPPKVVYIFVELVGFELNRH